MAKGDPQRIEAAVLTEAEKVIGKLQFRLLQALTSATPVDTGHARSGWFPSIGTPVTARLDRAASDSATKQAASARRRANFAKAQQILRAYRITMGNVYLTNPVSYMIFLNAGTSAQAGPRFVDRQIELVVKSFGGRSL